MENHNESSHDNLKHFINSKVDDSVSFNIPLVDYEYVLKELLSLKDGNAVGLDGLPPKLLHIAAPVIARPLTRIFNMSITSGIFPDEWKTGKVVPILKKYSNQDHGKFRPISILSTLSKLLERHIHISFYNFLKTKNLLHLAQSRFRHLFSWETALSNILNKCTEAIDKGLLNGVILLDLCKAFDPIDHNILKKLQMYECYDATMK